MALEQTNSNGMFMPVAPMYGNGLGGSDGWWIILLLLACGGGWGFGGGFGGGYGNMMLGYDFPWLLNGQNGINNNVNDGFRDAQLSSQISGIQNAVTSGFGDVQLGIAGVNQNICQTGNATVAAITGAQNAVSQQLYNNEIASLNRSFAEQTANAQGFTNVQSNLCDIRYGNASNTRDIIESQTRGTQAILDKLCALELEGVKGQLAQAQRENVALQNQINMGALRESQTAQNAFIAQEINQQNENFYNRLSTCPIPSTPVYGRTNIFTCNGNNGCGCGCGNGF